MKVPLLRSADPDRPVLWSDGRSVSARELMQRVSAVARALPEGQHLVNLCERRDLFLIACCAALVRGHTSVLPPSRASDVVDEISSLKKGSYRCDDDFVLRACEHAADGIDCNFQLPAEHLAIAAFTSGSTGTPQQHAKTWGGFARSSELNASRIRECLAETHRTARPWIVATVPPQHMYGLETSVILPLVSDMAVHAARPLFPADIAAALAEVPEPRVLVTTPVHARAIVASGQRFPPVAVVVSATAPLDTALAAAIERQLETVVLEMFGSTETCVIATRRTSAEEPWHLYPGVNFEPDAEGVHVSAPWFTLPAHLQDVVVLRGDRHFIIRGRNSDMVDVAGKRASLADLTRRLMSVPGVLDAVVFQPDVPAPGMVRRVAALVVAPSSSSEAICEHLSRSIDPVFIPRPLIRVDSLPRNETGKLPREKLLAAVRASTKQ